MLIHRKTLNIGGVKGYHIQRYCKLNYWLKNIHFVTKEIDVDNLLIKYFKVFINSEDISLTVLLEI